MFSEDYKRGVCLDDLDVGLDWNALIKARNLKFYREVDLDRDCDLTFVYLLIWPLQAFN